MSNENNNDLSFWLLRKLPLLNNITIKSKCSAFHKKIYLEWMLNFGLYKVNFFNLI